MTSVSDCNTCGEGTYCPVGSGAATPCAAGTFNNQTAQETCLKCAAGTFQDDEGATACKACTDGYYCAEGAAAALPCPGGTTKQVGVTMTSVSDCNTCGEGTYCPVGSGAATPCAAGTFNSLPQQETCVKCARGTYQDDEGATACKTCVAGSYCADGSAAALPCAAGTYSTATDLWDSINCTACPVGHSCSTGSLTPSPCAAGSFAAAERAILCSFCLPGTYQGLSGQTECVSCVSGSYCALGSSAPLPCPGGVSPRACSLAMHAARSAGMIATAACSRELPSCCRHAPEHVARSDDERRAMRHVRRGDVLPGRQRRGDAMRCWHLQQPNRSGDVPQVRRRHVPG